MSTFRHFAGVNRKFVTGCCALMFSGMVLAGQLDTASFFKLERGMRESEVLLRVGEPDLVTSPGSQSTETASASVVDVAPGVRGIDEQVDTSSFVIKEYHYIPGPDEPDPYLTIVTFKGGLVTDIERTKVFTRAPRPSGSSGRGRSLSDEEIRSRSADDALEAARRYSETRSRLKKELSAEQGGTSREGISPVYREQTPEGTPYYGDRPISDD